MTSTKFSKECAAILGVTWNEEFHQDFMKLYEEWEKDGLALLFKKLPTLKEKHS